MYTPTDLEKAKERIKSGRATFVIMHAGNIVGEANGMGVKPILLFLENEPTSLQGAEVADKIVGKAAAILSVLGGVQYVYGEKMSVSGLDYLENAGIVTNYDALIESVKNRDDTDVCPLEACVADIDDPQEGYEAIKETISRLHAK
ncbi:MAG: DUF1893 domain-containing protein [Defluviitaleaceae bacterium]|nr:DUF1893 domain-containing protein [Defluviitaleaceae bacterium]